MIVFIQVFDPAVIELVRDSTIEGDIYADKECWVNPVALAYYQQHGHAPDDPMFAEVE
jgi:hypothetical protein